MFDFVHSDPPVRWACWMWIGTLFEVCMIVPCSFLHDNRSVLQWALDTDQTEAHYGAVLSECFSISKCAYLRKSFGPFTPLFAPRPLCNIFCTTPLALNGISMAGLRFSPPLHPTGVVCIPRRSTFEIHFQVNMLWLATNLQPTGVVTAVPDNSQNKLLSRSGMFTVTTDTVRQTFLHLLFGKKEIQLSVSHRWIVSLTCWPFCVPSDNKWRGKSANSKKRRN